MIRLERVEELGPGVLNVNKYQQAYVRAAKSQFIEGATFKIILPVSEIFFTGNQDGNEDGIQDGNQDNLIVAINR